MKSNELVLGPSLRMPRDAVTQTFAFLGKRESGKSNAAGVLAEELFRAGAQFGVIDPVGIWWGLRVLQDGKTPGLKIYVFGGRHGDLPLLPGTGRLVAKVAVEKGISFVLDLSMMRKSERQGFVHDFAEELFELQKENRTPIHLLCEEAQNWMPQVLMKGGGGGWVPKLLGVFEDIIQQGRNFGIGVSLISQRPQSINKSVLNQTEALVCFQMNGRSDREAIAAWVEENEINDEGGLLQRLPHLVPGEAVLWSPGWLKRLEVVKFRLKHTYHAGATPRLGQKVSAPKRLAEVDVEQLRSLFADVAAQVEAADPKALQRKVAELERALRAAKADGAIAESLARAPAAPVRPWKPDQKLTKELSDAQKSIAIVQDKAAFVASALERALDWALTAPVVDEVSLPRSSALLRKEAVASGRTPLEARVAARPPWARSLALPASPTRPLGQQEPHVGVQRSRRDPGDGTRIPSGMLDMLRALATGGPRGGGLPHSSLSTRGLATLSWIKPGGSTFRTYLPALKRLDLVITERDVVKITDAGLAKLDDAREMTRDEVVEGWRRKLPGGAMRMLDHLLLNGHMGTDGAAIDGADLARAADIIVGGSTFRTYLPLLVQRGLVDRSENDRNRVIAAREIF
jgi:hypothetical protein